jgi:hypothetical protein
MQRGTIGLTLGSKNTDADPLQLQFYFRTVLGSVLKLLEGDGNPKADVLKSS